MSLLPSASRTPLERIRRYTTLTLMLTIAFMVLVSALEHEGWMFAVVLVSGAFVFALSMYWETRPPLCSRSRV